MIPQIFNRFRRLFLVEPNLRNHLVNLRNQTQKAILQKSSNLMKWVVKAIATVGGVGYLPVAPGTAGSFVGFLVGYLVVSWGSPPLQLLSLAVTFLVSVVVSTAAERLFATHDPVCVVIDEVWGMWAVMTAVPLVCQVPWLAALAFGLFRVFDIAKPPPLKWLARAPGGLGIVLDDAGAAAYTVGALWVIVAVIRPPI